MGGASVNGATDALGSAQNLLHGARQLAGHAAGAHRLGNGQHVVVGDVAAVLDWKREKERRQRGLETTCPWVEWATTLTVLDLLAVPWGLLEGFDDQGGGRGHHGDGGHTVLDAQLHGDLQTLPVTSSLGDIVSDLLGRLEWSERAEISRLSSFTRRISLLLHTYQTQWTDLGGQGRCGTDLTTDASHVHCK